MRKEILLERQSYCYTCLCLSCQGFSEGICPWNSIKQGRAGRKDINVMLARVDMFCSSRVFILSSHKSCLRLL